MLVDRALAERRADSEERREAGIRADRENPDGEPMGPSEPGDRASPDETAAFRLLVRRRRTIERLADPRARRQWAYALLARNGFDPSVARTVAARVGELSDEAIEPDESASDDLDSNEP
jgi:hypothetical protein